MSVISRRPAASLRTLVIGAGGLIVIAAARTVDVLEYGGVLAVSVAGDAAEMLLSILAAVVVFAVAVALRNGGVHRRSWMLIALGLAAYAVGNVAWLYLRVVNEGAVPYPGSPDVLYLLSYALLAAGLLSAAYSFRDIADIRPAAGTAVTIGVLALGLLYVGYLEPRVLSSADLTSAEKMLDVFYPISDILLLMTPALTVLFILLRLNALELAWPWAFVVMGTVLLGASDVLFVVLLEQDSHPATSMANYGWMASHFAFAVGASLAADVSAQKPRHLAIGSAEATPRAV